MGWIGSGHDFLIKQWVGLGWVSNLVAGLEWVLKIGPTAMSGIYTETMRTTTMRCILQTNKILSEIYSNTGQHKTCSKKK